MKLIQKKNQNKTHFEEGSFSHTSPRDGSGYQNKWIFGKGSKQPFTLRPSEWSLSLEIMCNSHCACISYYLALVPSCIYSAISIIKKIATLFSQNEVASKERRINRNIKLNRSCSHFDTLSLALCERDGPAWHAMPFHFWATHPLPPTPALWQQSQDHAREKCRPSGQGLGKSATPLLGWSECLLCMVHSTIGVVKMNPKTDCLCCQQRCITSMHYWLQALKEVKSGIIAKYFQNFWQLYTYLQNSMINSNLEGSMLQFAHI